LKLELGELKIMVAGIAAGTDWQSIVAEKRLLRNHLIEPFLAEKHVDDTVTNIADVEELAQKIADGNVKSLDVTKAYIARFVVYARETESNVANSTSHQSMYCTRKGEPHDLKVNRYTVQRFLTFCT
jgi:hypothetical protein